MKVGQMLGLGLRNTAADLAKQRVNEKSATHANATMNPPYRKLNAQIFQSFAPGQHVLVNAIDQCPIEVE
jgi:hypothetical protein